MPSEARLKFLEKMIILGPETAILRPQFCRILVLGPHFWWSGGARAPPGLLRYFRAKFDTCWTLSYQSHSSKPLIFLPKLKSTEKLIIEVEFSITKCK